MLALVGLALCAANVAITLQRTAIPRELRGSVTSLHALHEKHPGIDDVLLVALDNQAAVQIERELYDQLSIGARIGKAAWSTSLTIDGTPGTILWSVDFRGMSLLMPLVVAGLLVLAFASARFGVSRDGADGDETEGG